MKDLSMPAFSLEFASSFSSLKEKIRNKKFGAFRYHKAGNSQGLRPYPHKNSFLHEYMNGFICRGINITSFYQASVGKDKSNSVAQNGLGTRQTRDRLGLILFESLLSNCMANDFYYLRT